MVTDFLDTYRDENGQFLLRLNEFDIIRLVRESILQVKLFARDKSLNFKFESALERFTVKADCNRLKRVCVNLLENAVKYSPENGIIKIEFSLLNGYDCDELKDKLVPVRQQKRMKPEIPFMMLSVSDDGIGIAKSAQRFVFDKFFATNYKNGQGRKGFGLGLAFCKLVVEAHGGQIWVTSPFNDNKVFKSMGCRFSFTLPV
jgi:signal transduction histidine kinase